MAEKKEKQYVSDNARLMAEWDFEKNSELGLDSKKLTCWSHKKVWWKCSKGHEWLASIAHRNNGRGCPYCSSNKVSIGYNDLQTANPTLATDWNFEKNEGLTPTVVMPNSNKKVWWKCKNGHEWQASIAHRNNGRGCPYCSGKLVLEGFNDLITTHYSLCKEWDYDKNKSLIPTMVSKGSEKIVWWKCKHGHSWKAPIYSRVSGVGCPSCMKEKQISYPEKAIFFYLSKYFENSISNYRSSKLGTFEIDIFIPDYNIGVEYDGERWHSDIERDLMKNSLCKELNITLIRIREPLCPILMDNASFNIILNDKKRDLSIAIVKIFNYIESITNSRLEVDVDLIRDNMEILSLTSPSQKVRSISTITPELIHEWDYEKNIGITPDSISVGSDKKVWWMCSNNHSYISAVSSRARGRGCPICAGKKVLKGFNDFESRFPNLAREWDFDKNDQNPDEVAFGSDKKVWWKCNNGHSYISSVNNRRAGNGCPYCSGRRKLST